MDQGINSALTGLMTGLTKYLDLGNQYQLENAQAEKKNKAAMDLETFKSDLDYKKAEKLEIFKLAQKGKVSIDMARKIDPKLTDAVVEFEKTNKREMTESEFNTLYDNLNKGAATAEQKESNRQQRYNQASLNFSEQLQKNDVYKAIKGQGLALDSVDQLINTMRNGNTVASAAVGAKIARAMGEVGVLTEEDVKRYRQSGQITQKGADILSGWMQGKPTDATMSEIQSIVKVLKEKHQDKVQPVFDDYVNRLSANMGMSKEEASTRLNVPYAGSVKQQKIQTKEIKPSKNDPLGLGI